MGKEKRRFDLYVMSNSKLFRAIRNGFVMVIPLIMLGSFALIVKSLQITPYQNFINSFCGGLIFHCADFVYEATFGLLSVYITATISYNYALELRDRDETLAGPVLTSMACLTMLTGVQAESFSISALGVKGMFTALVSALLATRLYLHIKDKAGFRVKVYSDGTDSAFNQALSTMLPGGITLAFFAFMNFLFTQLFHVNGFHEFFINAANNLFLNAESRFGSGILFVFLSSLLWFFGIHGSDVLDGVVDMQFVPKLEMNQLAVQAGNAPTEILTKQFFDCFILMGGCGATLSLLIAIYIFSKRRGNKRLAKAATIPLLFNINEIIVFGLPIIFNPVMLIPFLATPCVMYFISYLAMWIGVVPKTVNEIEWTTPVLLSGYLATNSIRGSLLQAFNLVIGVLIYMPFIKIFDRMRERNAGEVVQELVIKLQEAEKQNHEITLFGLGGEKGAEAKALTADLREALEKGQIKMFYQPQFNQEKECIGAEALMRWKHPIFGMMYPPLVIKLAEEAGMLTDLEKYIFETTFEDRRKIVEETGMENKLCINVSAATLQKPEFLSFLRKIKEEYIVKESVICIEITEQTALFMSAGINDVLAEIKKMGYLMAIDDFSMGYTSIKYLQSGFFDLVKLDGSLIKEMDSNERNCNIIESIVHLSQSLGFSVLAEYVETDKQQKMLEEIGCKEYQRYLFSPAVPIDKYMEICSKR